MPRPVVGNYAEGIYQGVLPIAVTDRDEANGWPFLRYCGLLGSLHELIDSIVTESDDGPGWSSVLDLDRTPSGFLDWLGQFNGVRTTTGYTDAQKRMEIRDAKGFRRGTPASLIAAAKLALVGPEDEKRVTLIERDGSAYAFTIITYTSQTTDPAAVVRALVGATGQEGPKPAGLFFTHEVRDGWIYNENTAFYVGQTYADMAADFPDYAHLRDRLP